MQFFILHIIDEFYFFQMMYVKNTIDEDFNIPKKE